MVCAGLPGFKLMPNISVPERELVLRSPAQGLSLPLTHAWLLRWKDLLHWAHSSMEHHRGCPPAWYQSPTSLWQPSAQAPDGDKEGIMGGQSGWCVLGVHKPVG